MRIIKKLVKITHTCINGAKREGKRTDLLFNTKLNNFKTDKNQNNATMLCKKVNFFFIN